MNKFNEIQQGILMSSKLTPFQKIVYVSVHIKDLFGGKLYNIPERLGVELFNEMDLYVESKELVHTGTNFQGESYFGYLIYKRLNPPETEDERFLKEMTQLVFYNRKDDKSCCVINRYDREISIYSDAPNKFTIKEITPMTSFMEHNLKNLYKTINGREVKD